MPSWLRLGLAIWASAPGCRHRRSALTSEPCNGRRRWPKVVCRSAGRRSQTARVVVRSGFHRRCRRPWWRARGVVTGALVVACRCRASEAEFAHVAAHASPVLLPSGSSRTRRDYVLWRVCLCATKRPRRYVCGMPSCRYVVRAIALFNNCNLSVCISWREGCRGEAIPFAERMASGDGSCLVPTGVAIVSAVVPSVPMSDRSAGLHACSLFDCRQGRFAQARQTAENG